ncbi:hypothetical protein TNCV_309161 [Trichonephila clavipes]|nr:hypothetical protein TNCV_309161 [Trichonephila clavipes]
MVWLVSIPILRENTLGVVRIFHFSSSFTNLLKGLAAQRLFRVPLPSPLSLGLEPRPIGTAASVADYSIGWALRVLVAALWDKKLAFRTRERRKILDFYGRTATQGEKEIFGSRAASKFSFGERERPAHRRSN